MKWQVIKIEKLIENEENPRTIEKDKFEKLVKSIKEFPQMLELRPIVVNADFVVLGGNMRLKACKIAGIKEVPIVYADDLTPEQQKEFIIKDNVGFGEWDFDLLANGYDLEELTNWGMDIVFPTLEEGKEEKQELARQKLQEVFGVPPFTILDTRQGYWNERKKAWRELIVNDGASREQKLAKSENIISTLNEGVSIFDPVLAEAIVRWFGLPEGKVCDPFSGGAFGYVASYLGNEFTGIEIRPEQADINNERIKDFKGRYICDDGQNIAKHLEPESQDLIFSCPPYFNLEVYSDLPKDASNQKSYLDFLKILDKAFSEAVKCLKRDRFAVIVIGDVRDDKGAYLRLPQDISDIFINAGMILYNELVLIESLGTLPQRVGRWMKNRKVGKCHQNVLVFYKGDPKNISSIYPEITAFELQTGEEEGDGL